MRRRRRVLRYLAWIIAVAGVAVGAAVAAAALRLSAVGDDLRAAEALLRRASDRLDDGDLAGARADLQDARRQLVQANGELYGSPDIAVVGVLPIAEPNLDAIRSSVATALGVTGTAERVLRAAAPLEAPGGDLEVPLRDGAIPLETVDAVQAELDALLAAMPAGSPPDSAALLPQVRELVTEVHAEIAEQRPRVASLAAGLTLVEEVAGGNGDRRYLVAVANTAEMRGTGGMILSYGIVEGRGGDLSLGEFGPIDELFLSAPIDAAAGEASDDELARWSGLEPLRLWRNANLVPDPQVVGPRLEAMAESATGLLFDGVLHIDPAGLAALLEGVGPVEVAGLGRVDATNVVDLTLNQAYFRFPDNEQRRELLGDVAEAAFQRLVDGEYDSLRPLGEALARAAAERHVALWSSRPAAAGPASFFDADAAVPAPSALDHLLLSIQNVGRDKLDYYLQATARVVGSRPEAAPGRLTVELTFRNTAPEGVTSPEYVFGPDGDPLRRGPAGHYLGVVSLYVPVGTSLDSAAGGASSAPRLAAEGGRSVVGFDVDVPPGESVTVTVELTLPPRPPSYQLVLTPLPRVRPVVWEVEIDTGAGVVSRRGALVRQEIARPA